VFLAVGGGLSTLSWINHRKDRLRKEQEEQTVQTSEPKED